MPCRNRAGNEPSFSAHPRQLRGPGDSAGWKSAGTGPGPGPPGSAPAPCSPRAVRDGGPVPRRPCGGGPGRPRVPPSGCFRRWHSRVTVRCPRCRHQARGETEVWHSLCCSHRPGCSTVLVQRALASRHCWVGDTQTRGQEPREGRNPGRHRRPPAPRGSVVAGYAAGLASGKCFRT